MRAMSLPRSSPAVTSSAPAALASLASLVSLVSLAACGSGPTDGPKTPDEKLVVGGVLGDAGLTTAMASQESSSRSRPRAAVAEPKRPVDDDSAVTMPMTDPGPDPMNGSFTFAQAAAGLPPTGALVATIKTSKGELRCKLFEDKAPVAVANFVGLARGTRPFKDKNQWVTRAAYDGTTFHRVIKGFMVQGGDPQGTGRGEPGYVFKDELWTGNGSKHDRPGLLCMANRGPDTNGMQFFITDASAPHLDRSYTIFGECAPVSVVHAIANVPTESGDRPTADVTIDKVEISRGGVVAPAPAPSGAKASPSDAPKDGGAPATPPSMKP
jgi:peptidyl-prolyl cis-trans isomerase A (cyclophilin A)